MKRVCIFGSYKHPGKKQRQEIIKLGRLLAEKGYELITGGFGGTMEDISRGAKEAGGKTVGVTYYKYDDTKRKKTNQYVDKEIKTRNIFERIDVMMKRAGAFVVLPGGTGTLLELAACLEHINKGLMEPKPIIALGSFWRSAIETLSGEAVLSDKARSASGALSCRGLVRFAKTSEEISRLL